MNCNTNIINPLDMNVNDMQVDEIKYIVFECLKYKLDNHKLLTNVLNEIINNKTPPCVYYEYFNFTHNKYKQKVIERYLYHYVKIYQV